MVLRIDVEYSKINGIHCSPILEVLFRVTDEDVASKRIIFADRRGISLSMILARFLVVRLVHGLMLPAAITGGT